jgi:hypothetical protein
LAVAVQRRTLLGHAGVGDGALDRVGVVVDEDVGAGLDRVDPLGTPYQYASFCNPPESVTITRACDASAARSR